ncbi:MAG: hypothetical protein RLY93_07535 [Sumerlaeia bacterium]
MADDASMAFPDIQKDAQVHHPTFGMGKVLQRTGKDEKTAKAIIKFREEGEKKLALQFADLTVDKVDEDEAEGAAQ